MTAARPRLIDYISADEALADLCDGFVAEPAVNGACREVTPDDIPEPFRELLVHTNHMTTTLSKHCGRTVELRVLREQIDGDLYHRQIVLTPAGSNAIVECGIVRIDLSFTEPPMREAILRRAAPLGDILIEHRVLRRIEPRWYLRWSGDAPLLADFGCALSGDAYGRVGTIYCNHRPAIELLEIVTGTKLNW